MNANRMLRARKVLSYVAERLDTDKIPEGKADQADTWLELLCQEKVVLTLTELTVDCSSKVDLADYSGADVETGRGYIIYLSIKDRESGG